MKKKAIGLVLLVVISVLGGWFYQRSNQNSGITYQKGTVQKGKLEAKVLSTGTVLPENRVDIKPPIAGRAERILVDEGAYVKKGQILAWMSSTERAALLDAASARGAEELNHWKDLYKPTPVLAPINGMIIQRNVESGQTFTANDAILSMSDRLTVKAQVDETDIAQIKLKQAAVITLDAYATKPIPARVDQIAFDAKTTNNVTTYLVGVLPLETPEFMRSGMTANVSFDIASKDESLYVPADAIKTLNGKTFVMIPGDSPSAQPISRPVTTGVTDGKKVELIAGVSEGEVILIPEFKLDAKKQGSGSPFSPMGNRPRGR